MPRFYANTSECLCTLPADGGGVHPYRVTYRHPVAPSRDYPGDPAEVLHATPLEGAPAVHEDDEIALDLLTEQCEEHYHRPDRYEGNDQ